MSMNLTQQLIRSHSESELPQVGESVEIRFDQTLTQDATGTLVMLALEAMKLEKTRAEVSVQYIDHNLFQEDNRNQDDHLFLLSACERFGLWYSRPGNGISHPLHMQLFGIPGKTLIGSDSHTPASGALGMLAIGAGGADVAMAIAGFPVPIVMPETWGVELTGALSDWVSAKDVILEMLRRHGVEGGRNRVIEYFGPGLAGLTAMDRHVIANMGTELGATASVFPADDEVRRFLSNEGRAGDWHELRADNGCNYEHHEQIDLGGVEPLIAQPSSPGNVVPIADVAGMPVHQVYIGSSANPGYSDFAVVADVVEDREVADSLSFDINPTSRQLLRLLVRDGKLDALLSAGARLHQAGCNGCIGMGQAPATDKISLRTTPRNFPGRSGTLDDRVYPCSPETAAASALAGKICDPRNLNADYPGRTLPEPLNSDRRLLVPPRTENLARVELVKGPNIKPLPELEQLPNSLSLPVLLKLGDDVSTDEILPAGSRVLPYRSNIPKIAEFCFVDIAPGYAKAAESYSDVGHAIVGGANYGQGSSREHAALAPRYLGLRVVIAKSFARIHRQNLINYGVLPLLFCQAGDYDLIELGCQLRFKNVELRPDSHHRASLETVKGDYEIEVEHRLSKRAIEIVCCGGLINWLLDQPS